MRTRRDFIKTAGLCAAGAIAPNGFAATQLAADRPNILYIMADDHAATAIGCYGSRLAHVVRTPNIDRIATEGVRLDNVFCTNSICVPSRATILTGQYSHVNGVYTLGEGLAPERRNVAKLLQKAGYQTALVGKWHLKQEPAGFDYWNVLPGQGRYHDPVMTEKGAEKKTHQGFSTDVITDLSLEWLERRDKTQPFCLMTHFKNCHGPWHFAKRHASLYENVEIPEPESLWEDKSHRSEGSREYGFTMDLQARRMSAENYPTGRLEVEGLDRAARVKAAYQKYLKDYLRCVAALDENVGRLLAWLDRNGLAQNTLVIYTSDQGMFLGEHNYIDKRWIYEESMRMPFLARYPREIRPGGTNDALIANADFAPLFLDYAGAAAPGDMQGRSFRSILGGKTPTDWRRSVYYRYWSHGPRPAHYGVRTKRHKLIFFYGLPLDKNGPKSRPTKPGWELYDLEKDPKELRNVYGDPAYADVVKELRAELLRLKKELGDTDERYPELERLVASTTGKPG